MKMSAAMMSHLTGAYMRHIAWAYYIWGTFARQTFMTKRLTELDFDSPEHLTEYIAVSWDVSENKVNAA